MGSSPGWEDSSELVVGAESLIRLHVAEYTDSPRWLGDVCGGADIF